MSKPAIAYGPEKTAQALAEQKESPQDPDDNGVHVAFDGSSNTYRIGFEYDPNRKSMVTAIKAVKGSHYDDTTKEWTAPVKERNGVERAVGKIRLMQAEMPTAYDSLVAELKAEYKDYPIEKFPKTFNKTGKDGQEYTVQIDTAGPVMNFNGHYMAMMDLSREKQPRLVIHEVALLKKSAGTTDDGQAFELDPGNLKIGLRIKVAYEFARGKLTPSPVEQAPSAQVMSKTSMRNMANETHP